MVPPKIHNVGAAPSSLLDERDRLPEDSPKLSSTKQRILDSAEQLFTERGFSGTSLRAITSAAGVNLAAANYHFRSKEALFHAVLARRLNPINRKRLELLGDCEAMAEGGIVPLDQIVTAFIVPVLRAVHKNDVESANVGRLIGCMCLDPGTRARRYFAKQFSEVADRFSEALKRSLPGLSRDDLSWSLRMMTGVLMQAMPGPPLIPTDTCDPAGGESNLDRLVSFVVGGLRVTGVVNYRVRPPVA